MAKKSLVKMRGKCLACGEVREGDGVGGRCICAPCGKNRGQIKKAREASEEGLPRLPETNGLTPEVKADVREEWSDHETFDEALDRRDLVLKALEDVEAGRIVEVVEPKEFESLRGDETIKALGAEEQFEKILDAEKKKKKK